MFYSVNVAAVRAATEPRPCLALIRPLKAINLVHQKMGEMLAAPRWEQPASQGEGKHRRRGR